MQNISKEKNKLGKTNDKITFDGYEMVAVLKEIIYIVVSFDRIGSYYGERMRSFYGEKKESDYAEKSEREFEKETTQFIVNGEIGRRLSSIRRILTEKFDLTEGEDEMDDLERACEDIEYWTKPGDYSKVMWAKHLYKD